MNIAELVRYLKKRFVRIAVFPLRLFPVRNNRVLLINDMSSSFADNLKYIGLELKKRDRDFEVIYSGHALKCVEQLNDLGIIPVELNSIRYFYYGLTSKFVITNSGGISYLPLKRKQISINTWHGGGAYKKMGMDMYEDTKMFRKDLILAAKETDYVLATCERFVNVFSHSMLTPTDKFWNIGMPRNDILKNYDPEKSRSIKKKIGISEDDKLVLFAPTYRKVDDNYFNDSVAISYGIDEEATLGALTERFGGKWIFAYRFHPCIVNRQKFEQTGSIIDLTDYDDMQELLLAADVLINDFSSSMWDFMLTEKPCFIFAKDLERYIETTDLYTPVSEWPFSIAENNKQLVNNILNFDEDVFLANCKAHYDLLGGCESGEATKLVCDMIIDKCIIKK